MEPARGFARRASNVDRGAGARVSGTSAVDGNVGQDPSAAGRRSEKSAEGAPGGTGANRGPEAGTTSLGAGAPPIGGAAGARPPSAPRFPTASRTDRKSYVSG